MQQGLTRIGVFYDGNYFLHVSNYYNYDHARQARLSISGLHHFIEAHVAETEGRPGLSRIVDAQYFRNRLNAQDAQQRGSVLYFDRVFDDILMSSGITTHYKQLNNHQGKRDDNGVNLWLAVEALDAVMSKSLDVVVLIASNSDFVPLVRKIQGHGCRVLVLGWDFEFTTENGAHSVTRTSQDLLDTASHPIRMNEIIDDPHSKAEAALVNGIFVAHGNQSDDRAKSAPNIAAKNSAAHSAEGELPKIGELGERLEGEVFSLKKGFGFIKHPPNNLFFHHSALTNISFDELYVGDYVEFTLAHNDSGKLIATEVELVEDDAEPSLVAEGHDEA